MESDERKTIGVYIRMRPYERALIDFRARLAGMSRSRFIVKAAAQDKREFALDVDSLAGRHKTLYNIYRQDDPSIGYLPAAQGPKPRKAENNRVHAENVKMRVSPEEKRVLRQQLAAEAGMSLTDYMVFHSLYEARRRSRYVEARKELRGLLFELRAQGRNLNQMAVAMNRIALAAQQAESPEGVNAEAINRMVRELLEKEPRAFSAQRSAVEAVVEAIKATKFRDVRFKEDRGARAPGTTGIKG